MQSDKNYNVNDVIYTKNVGDGKEALSIEAVMDSGYKLRKRDEKGVDVVLPKVYLERDLSKTALE